MVDELKNKNKTLFQGFTKDGLKVTRNKGTMVVGKDGKPLDKPIEYDSIKVTDLNKVAYDKDQKKIPVAISITKDLLPLIEEAFNSKVEED